MGFHVKMTLSMVMVRFWSASNSSLLHRWIRAIVHENLLLPSQHYSTLHVTSWSINYPSYVNHYIKTEFGNFHVDRKANLSMVSTKDKQLLKYIYAFLSTTRKQGKRMLLGNDRWAGVIYSLPTVFHVQRRLNCHMKQVLWLQLKLCEFKSYCKQCASRPWPRRHFGGFTQFFL